jgi:hypothetical protein
MHSVTPAPEETLFAAFPEWRSLARSERADDGSTYVVIEVRAPPGANVEYGLIIDTSNQEVTVSFDFHHEHFDEWVGDGDRFGTEAAVELIRRIVSERIAVVSWWHGDSWAGSSQIEAGANPEMPSWAAPEAYNRVRIRSWNGSFNVDRDALYLPPDRS